MSGLVVFCRDLGRRLAAGEVMASSAFLGVAVAVIVGIRIGWVWWLPFVALGAFVVTRALFWQVVREADAPPPSLPVRAFVAATSALGVALVSTHALSGTQSAVLAVIRDVLAVAVAVLATPFAARTNEAASRVAAGAGGLLDRASRERGPEAEMWDAGEKEVRRRWGRL